MPPKTRKQRSDKGIPRPKTTDSYKAFHSMNYPCANMYQFVQAGMTKKQIKSGELSAFEKTLGFLKK